MLPYWVESNRLAEMRVDSILKRNSVMLCFEQLTMRQGMTLLGNNTFQAGLDALDPDAPCWVKDSAIQDIIVLGLMSMMRT